MIKTLVIPGLCLMVAVAGTYQSEEAKNDTDKAKTTFGKLVPVKQRGRVASDSTEVLDDSVDKILENELLEGWPVITRTSRISRAGPRRYLYAKIRSNQSRDLESPFFSLKSLDVVAGGKSHEFPLMVDHATGRALVFAEHQWQDYASWRLVAIERFKKQANGGRERNLRKAPQRSDFGGRGDG